MKTKLKDYLHLHLIVFIWGFTAVLGKLISIDALPLVWYRMLMAVALVVVFIFIKRFSLKTARRTLLMMLLGGVLIAIHWVTFFWAIKVSTVAVALATMSTGAFFTAILEPIWYKRRLIWYELLFGLLVIGGLLVIFQVETQYALGIGLALISSFLAALFSLINGKLVHEAKPSVIALYELGAGVLLLSVYLLITNRFDSAFFQLSTSDWLYLFILASLCTAYAFIASVKVMRFLSPYTVMLTINLEPVYGIVLAFFLLGEEEKMSPLFYLGAGIILITVLANGILKTQYDKRSLKKQAADTDSA